MIFPAIIPAVGTGVNGGVGLCSWIDVGNAGVIPARNRCQYVQGFRKVGLMGE